MSVRVIKEHIFTSDLSVYVFDKIEDKDFLYLQLSIKDLPKNTLIKKLNKFDPDNILNSGLELFNTLSKMAVSYKIPCQYLSSFIKYKEYKGDGSKEIDCQGFLKGYAIQVIMDKLKDKKVNNYIINFGGDLVINLFNASRNLNILSKDGNNFYKLNGDHSTYMTIFTSGNEDPCRGHHIIGDGKTKCATVTRTYDSSEDINPVLSDMISTSAVADENFEFEGYEINRTEYDKENIHRFRLVQ